MLVGLPDAGMRLSARNQFAGVVIQVTQGAVNTEVRIRLTGGNVMTAIVTAESALSLGLEEGVGVVAIVKASSVILGTTR